MRSKETLLWASYEKKENHHIYQGDLLILGMLLRGSDANPAPWAISSEGGLVAAAALAGSSSGDALILPLELSRGRTSSWHNIVADRKALPGLSCTPQQRAVPQAPQTPVSTSQAAKRLPLPGTWGNSPQCGITRSQEGHLLQTHPHAAGLTFPEEVGTR